MIALIARRAVASLAILVLVTFLVFLVVYFSPGDPVRVGVQPAPVLVI